MSGQREKVQQENQAESNDVSLILDISESGYRRLTCTCSYRTRLWERERGGNGEWVIDW